MERYWDPEFPDLADAVERWGPTGAAHRRAGRHGPGPAAPGSLFVRGLYGEQLARGLEHFPREQWLVLDFRDVFTRPEHTLDATTDFLGIKRFAHYPPVLHQNQTPTDHTGRAPSVGQVAGLVERFAPDLARLEELSGLDTSAWSTSRVAAGELSADELTAKLLAKLGLT